jgi:hypothetical protein
MAKRDNGGFHWVRDVSGKKHWVMKGTNPDLFSTPKQGVKYPYSKTTTELIMKYVAEGKSISEVGRMPGMPPHGTIFRWMSMHADFKLKIMNAREVRGFAMEEKALEAAELADEDNVASQKLKVDTYKWVAEVNNPEVYGKRTKLTGDVNNPIQFVVETGIRRNEEPAIEVDSKKESGDDIPVLPEGGT